ncbi:MAG TPA: hypothetical protein VIC85_08990 [Ktedonobacterales bacterium]|jgi:hypothetical protein
MSSAEVTSSTRPRRLTRDPRPALRRAFAVNAPLTVAGLAMALALLVAVVGLGVDRQVITRAPA